MPFDGRIFYRELGRKAFHIGGCVIPAAYCFFIPRTPMAIILCACVLGAGFLEYMRLTGRDLYPTSFMRPSEDRRLGGYFYAAVAMFLAVLAFDKAVATAAILCLIFGDSITGLAGALWLMYSGKKSVDVRENGGSGLAFAVTHHKPPGLMLLMFAICAAVGLAFYPGLSYLAIAAGAIGAVIADAFPWRIGGYTIDDNLSIPLLAGALMTLAMLV